MTRAEYRAQLEAELEEATQRAVDRWAVHAAVCERGASIDERVDMRVAAKQADSVVARIIRQLEELDR